MKILEVIRSLNVGGSQQLLLTRLATEASSFHNIKLINTLPREQALLGLFKSSNIETTSTRSNNPVSANLELLRLIRTDKPEVVVIHSPLPAVLLKLSKALGLCKPPVIEVVHSTRYTSALVTIATVLTNRFSAMTLPVSTAVARSINNKFARDTKVLHHGVPREKMVSWVENHADIVATQRAVMSMGLHNPLEVVFCGRLTDQKRPADIIGAMDILRDSNITLTMVGGGPLLDEIRRQVTAAELGGRVAVLGEIPEGWKYVAAGDCLVLSSSHEGLGVVVMESLSLGKPVVASDIDSMNDILTNNQNALLFPLGDVSALANALRKLEEDRGLLQRLSINALSSSQYWDVEDSSTNFYSVIEGKVRARQH